MRLVVMGRVWQGMLRAGRTPGSYRLHERYGGTPLQVGFQSELRPEQKAAADAMLAHDTGVLAAPVVTDAVGPALEDCVPGARRWADLTQSSQYSQYSHGLVG